MFIAIRTKELENIENNKKREGHKKKFQDGDLGVLKFSPRENEGIQTDSSDEEALLL